VTDLDTLYDLRARHPDSAVLIPGWTARSIAARAALPNARLDLPYGEGPGERLDLFPAASPDTPVVSFLHGGYWQALGKDDSSYLAPAFVAAGIGVAVPDYTLAPAAGLDRMLDEMRRAHLWLHGQVSGSIVALGHSAGGQLATMLLADPAMPLAAAVSIGGIYDLEPLRHTFLNRALGLDAETARRNSPLHMTPPPGARVLCLLGADESPALHDQQAAFAAAWNSKGAVVETHIAPNLHHFTIMDRAGEETSAISALIRDFIRSVVTRTSIPAHRQRVGQSNSAEVEQPPTGVTRLGVSL
jgi:arylformamidase